VVPEGSRRALPGSPAPWEGLFYINPSRGPKKAKNGLLWVKPAKKPLFGQNG